MSECQSHDWFRTSPCPECGELDRLREQLAAAQARLVEVEQALDAERIDTKRLTRSVETANLDAYQQEKWAEALRASCEAMRGALLLARGMIWHHGFDHDTIPQERACVQCRAVRKIDAALSLSLTPDDVGKCEERHD